MTSDGKPYSLERYKEIVQERYLLAKHANISYADSLNITPLERTYLLKFIMEDFQQQEEAIERQKAARQLNK